MDKFNEIMDKFNEIIERTKMCDNSFVRTAIKFESTTFDDDVRVRVIVDSPSIVVGLRNGKYINIAYPIDCCKNSIMDKYSTTAEIIYYENFISRVFDNDNIIRFYPTVAGSNELQIDNVINQLIEYIMLI